MNCLLLSIALSFHLNGTDVDYNSIHPHIRCGDENVIAGAYYNSENNLSVYMGRKLDITRYMHDDGFTLEYGIVAGYDRGLMPMARITKGNWYFTPLIEKDFQRDRSIYFPLGLVIGYEVRIK